MHELRRDEQHTELSFKILGPLKILHETQSMRLLVAPDTREARTIAQWADGVFPVPVRLVGVALEHVAAREADNGEAGFVQCFREVDTKTVRPALERGRKEADKIEVEIPIGSALELMLVDAL